ncbi:hypothetical protein [Bacillus sp. 1NLA3E]|uniref:hypothetical protein n=1 Tax=Bacillus sp. 1NLA3E TaxID=666686 RepID=UPI000247E662|nr:hypothetical protein [Bacillus sp. 1NLA3E]
MKSGWIINYKNGNSEILSKEKYKIYNANKYKGDVKSEEHWFNIEDAKRKNPNLPVHE